MTQAQTRGKCACTLTPMFGSVPPVVMGEFLSQPVDNRNDNHPVHTPGSLPRLIKKKLL